MKIKLVVLLFFLLLGIFSITSLLFVRLTSPEASPAPTDASSRVFEPISIQVLKERNPASGSFNVDGYIAKIFSCPPCPAGAECMPCMPENIVISERPKTVEAYNALTSSEIIVFVQNPEQIFEVGEHYIFSIQVTEFRTTDEPINDVELISYIH